MTAPDGSHRVTASTGIVLELLKSPGLAIMSLGHSEHGGFCNERAYQDTGKPFYAWDEMHRARSADPPEPIPEWCWPVLDHFLHGLYEAKPTFRDRKLSALKKGIKLSQIVGLNLGHRGKPNAVVQQDKTADQANAAQFPPKAVSAWHKLTAPKLKKLWRW